MKSNKSGNNISYYRMKAGLSQKELGDKINYAAETICKYETGFTEVRMSTAVRIAKELHVSLDDLFMRKVNEKDFLDVRLAYNSKIRSYDAV